MKGLLVIPKSSDLAHAYERLQSEVSQISDSDWVLYGQWVRFDARLGEIWISSLIKSWKNLSPLKLNVELKRSSWPAVVGVLLEFSKNLIDECSDKKIFELWAACVMAEISKSNEEQFFIGLYPVGSASMLEEVVDSLKPYRKWGYFAKDPLFSSKKDVQRTLLTIDQRRKFLKQLLKTHRRVTVQSYRRTLQNCVSLRQAQRDFKHWLGRARAVGSTKGRYYKRHKQF